MWRGSSPCGSPVAGRAAGTGVDLIALGQRALLLARVVLGLPGHVRDLLERPDVPFGTAVTFQAPAHCQRRCLFDRRHLVDAPVAADAADALVHVDRVIE